MHGYREEDALGGYDPSMPVEMAKELGLDHLLKIAEAGTHPIIRIIPHSTLPIAHLVAPTGDLSTQSFYPPHHLTMGEGGGGEHHPPPAAENLRRDPDDPRVC